LKKHGVRLPPENILCVPKADVAGRVSGVDAMRRLKELRSVPDGVFCYNDVIAVGVIKEAQKQGIRIPADMTVIGCGNLHYDDEISVPLTSIDQRSSEMGSRTAKLILEVLTGETPRDYRNVVLQPRLVARASTTGSR